MKKNKEKEKNKKKNKEFHMDFGVRLRAAREQNGLTRELFAELIGKSPTFVADIERGSVGVSVSTLMRICETLSISSDHLLWNKTAGTSLDERLQFLDPEYITVIEKNILNQIELIRIAKKQFMPENQQDEQQEEQQNEQQEEPTNDQN